MNFIFVGTLLGSLVTSQHDTREACLGRQAVLQEKGVVGECIHKQQNEFITNGTTGTGSFFK